ncbi:MAG TPA: hypothetical protein VEI57_06485 [Nitrospirota bacterium]|nr:hypothetical protein [Nitrospirota bacterium]
MASTAAQSRETLKLICSQTSPHGAGRFAAIRESCGPVKAPKTTRITVVAMDEGGKCFGLPLPRNDRVQ